jgi:hypothetical protein
MDDRMDLIRELADIQARLSELPEDAYAERDELRRRQEELRSIARSGGGSMDADRPTPDLLAELASLRAQMRAIERQRIDLVKQAGSGGPSSGEMGNLGGVQINKGIDDAQGLPHIKARIGVIKGVLSDRGVPVPEAG